MERHQYGFGVMNGNTGGIRRKSFWGCGATEDDCRKDAFKQAHRYGSDAAELT